jgi:hypothetical protein
MCTFNKEKYRRGGVKEESFALPCLLYIQEEEMVYYKYISQTIRHKFVGIRRSTGNILKAEKVFFCTGNVVINLQFGQRCNFFKKASQLYLF